jgi:hypothetical protein
VPPVSRRGLVHEQTGLVVQIDAPHLVTELEGHHREQRLLVRFIFGLSQRNPVGSRQQDVLVLRLATSPGLLAVGFQALQKRSCQVEMVP